MQDTSLSLLDRLRVSPNNADWTRLVEAYSPLLRTWVVRADAKRQAFVWPAMRCGSR